MESHSHFCSRVCPRRVDPFRVTQPLRRIQRFVAVERGQRLAKAGSQMERVSDRTRLWLDTTAIRSNAWLDAPPVRCGLRVSATCPACHADCTDKTHMEDDLHFAVSGLVRESFQS